MDCQDLKYSPTHEWVKVEGEQAVVGITCFAQEQLHDVVYVEMPAVGSIVQKGQECAAVESNKAAASVYAPLSGTITAVNEALIDAPQRVNLSPQGDGWLFKMTIDDPTQLNELMDQETYQEKCRQE